MSRLLAEFQDAMEWNLVGRHSYQVPENRQAVDRVPPVDFLVENSHVVIIGCDAQLKRSTWRTAGWAAQTLPFLPSSTSNFTASVEGSRQWLPLGRLKLCVFPKTMPTWRLRIEFPWWLNDITLEVWRYDGADRTEFDYLTTIQEQIGSLI